MVHWRACVDAPALSADYSLPRAWRGWLFRLDAQINPGWQWIIFGPAGAGLPEHEDMLGTATWNALIAGEKSWTLHGDAPIRFVQRPGDIIYLPSGVPHSVEYDATSIALSENIVDAACARAVHTGLVAKQHHGLARVIERLSELHAEGRLS
jgi:hypothetical protein